MVNIKEREPILQRIEERPEEISPLTIEKKEVVTPTLSHFNAQVTDDQGQPLIQTPPAQAVTITIPADQATLVSMTKGSAENAVTWLAAFWLRMIKKALHFGWKIINK